jgi:hypothetical protein
MYNTFMYIYVYIYIYIYIYIGAVENWLNELVKFMQLTLKNVLSSSMTDAVAWEVRFTSYYFFMLDICICSYLCIDLDIHI